MTSDSDDLERRALQENMKLRRELSTKVAKAEAASQRGGIAYRLGWVRVLYWTCFASGAGFLLYGLGRAFRYVLSGE
jgi:hypothetical protein